MFNGKIQGIVSGDRMNEEEILQLIFGQKEE
jgi:hypothetical protein